MDKIQKPYEMINDFLTGKEIPNVGAEENRQAVERFLVEQKKYVSADIILNKIIDLKIGFDRYNSQVDMLIQIEGQSVMVIKCVAGSLGSHEREVIAAARLLETNQIPVSIVSDGKTALLRDVITGKKMGEGLQMIPSRDDAVKLLESYNPTPLPEDRVEREKLVFRTYDSMNVNVGRNVQA